MDVKSLQAMFPGALFQAPGDLVVPLPSPIDSPFGVQLRGGGSLAFLNSLPEQLQKIKKAFEDQANRALQEAEDYLNRQAESISESRNKWRELSASCDEAMGNFQKGYSESMKKQAEEQGKAAAKMGEFCFKFNRLKRTNPLAGCDGSNSPAKLYKSGILFRLYGN
jgi:vacuolar-type H+-ATPase subunit H